MSDRRNKSKTINKTIAWTAAGLVHLIIIGALVFNFTSEPEVVEAFDADKIEDTIKATVVDESQIKNREDEIKRRDRENERDKREKEQRLKDLQRDAELESKRIDDLKLQTQSEQIAAEQAERTRKEVQLKAEQEQIERLKKEQERKKREEAEQRKRAQQVAEKAQADEQARIQRERQERAAQMRLNQLLEEETRMLEQQERARQEQAAAQQAAQRTTTVLNRYVAKIQEAIDAKRSLSPDFERWRVVRVSIKLSSRGDVLSARILNSSGSERYDRDAETAIRLASPLPVPTRQEDAGAYKVLVDDGIILKITMPGAS